MNTDKQLPVIERNFHILNDDRFIMEKISLPVEQQEGEDIHAALNRTREIIVQNFKAAYPKVEHQMNFDEAIQVNNQWGVPKDIQVESPPQLLKINGKPVNETPEKINKGTIEEQIEACKTMGELSEWRILAESTKKLKPIYEKKLAELETV